MRWQSPAVCLAQVDNRSKYGFLTKNHLLLAMQMLADGRIKQDHDEEAFWTAPPKGDDSNKELHEVLERGLEVLLLCKSIWDHESVEDIKLIIDVDNQDSINNLPDHEVHLFERIRGIIAEKEKQKQELGEVVNLKTLFETVFADVKGKEGAFSKNDCICIYNLALQLPAGFGDFLTRFHFQYVNPSVLKVMPKIYQLVATLHDRLPRVKIALLLMCYMCESTDFKKVGNMLYADAIDKGKMEKLVKHEKYLIAAEAFLKHCFEGCQPQLKNPAVFKALVRLAIAIGRQVYKGPGKDASEDQELGDRTEKFAAAERELWEDVKRYDINCEPRLTETKSLCKMLRKKKKEGSEQEPIAVDGPPLKFDDAGEMVRDLAYHAAKDGIQVGVSVVVTKKCTSNTFRREVVKNEEGTVVSVDEAHVGVAFGSKDIVPMPRSALLLKSVVETAAEPPKKKQKVDNPSTAAEPSKKNKKVDNPPPVRVSNMRAMLKWAPTEVADHNTTIGSMVISSLLHLSEANGPKDDEVSFFCMETCPIALRDFNAKELKLFPYSPVCSQEEPRGDVMYIGIEATVGNHPAQTFYVSEPARVANLDPKGVQKVSPFWNAARSTRSMDDPNIDKDSIDMHQMEYLFAATLSVTAKCDAASSSSKKSASKTSKVPEEFKSCKGGVKVVFKFPYLTNTIAVERGQSLCNAAIYGIQAAHGF